MVSEPGNSREIWKPLKVPDDGRNYQQRSAGSINDPPDIEEQQATKTFFRTDHSTNIFTATSSTIPETFDFFLPHQPGGWSELYSYEFKDYLTRHARHGAILCPVVH